MHHYKNIKFRNKLLISFIVLILIPTIMIGVVSYIVFRQAVLDEIGFSTQKVLLTVTNNINGQLHNIEEVQVNVLTNDRLKTIFEDGQPDDNAKTTYLRWFYNDIFPSVFEGLLNQISSVYFFGYNGVNLVSDVNRDALYRTVDELEMNSLYRSAKQAGGAPVWMPSHKDGFVSRQDGTMVFSFAVEVLALYSFKPWGVLVVNVPENYFYKLMDKSLQGMGGAVYLLDSQGTVLSAANKNLIAQPMDEDLLLQLGDSPSANKMVRYQGDRYFANVVTTERNGWRLLYLIPEAKLFQKIDLIKNTIISVGVGTLMLAVLLALLISSGIQKPIKILMKQMEKVKLGDLSSTVQLSRSDEIGILGNRFNGMMAEIQNLLAKVKEDQEKIRISELKSLQAQINPHFLYNALDSIYWMTKNKEYEEVGQMSVALAQLFRLSLNGGNELTTVRNELKHLEVYLSICQLQHPRLEYQIDVAGPIEDYECLKLILQPLAENAVKHALFLVANKAHIRVAAYKEGGDIVFEVADNGQGADIGKLNSIIRHETVRSRSGFGLYNVHERLQLKYGADYGLSFALNEQGGLTVRVVITGIMTEEEPHLVQAGTD